MRCAALLLCIVLLAPAPARAAGYAISEQSPVAGGTGGAGAARSGDPSAVWYNPAALADGAGLRAAASLLVALPQLDARARDGSWSAQTDAPPSTPPALYASFARGPFAAGIGLNVPFGSSVMWPASWPGRFEAVSSQLQVFRLAPFAAWRFGRLRLGAGVHVDLASLKIRRRLDFIEVEGDVAVDFSAVGVGGHAALFLDVHRMLALGASYKSRTLLALEGPARFDAPLAFSGRAQDQRARARYALPDLITVGAELRPHPRVAALLDIGLTIWSVYERLHIDFEREQTTDVELAANWRTRPFVRAGGELRVRRWLAARLGVLWDPTPVPGATIVPSSPDSHRLGVSAGAGLALPWGVSLDAFYTYVQFLGQNSDNRENLAASYGGRLHLVGVGLRYAWNPTAGR